MKAPAYLIRQTAARDIRVRAGHMGLHRPESASLIFPHGRDKPVMWWLLEHRIGVDYIEKKIQGRVQEVEVGAYSPHWQEAAGTLVDSMLAMAWVYEAGVWGEMIAPRCEWLCCNVCDAAQLRAKADGAASKKCKCKLTPRCEGIVRRLPNIFEVTGPKRPLPPRAPKVCASVAELVGYPAEIADEEAAYTFVERTLM